MLKPRDAEHRATRQNLCAEVLAGLGDGGEAACKRHLRSPSLRNADHAFDTANHATNSAANNRANHGANRTEDLLTRGCGL
jgi:hypothetical protein